MGLGDLLRNNLEKWVKNASLQELKDEYEKERQAWIKGGFNHGTGRLTPKMQLLANAINIKSGELWAKDPRRSKDPNFRWTDANRWEK